MKRVLLMVLVVAILSQPITVKANSLSNVPPDEVDGIPQEIKEIAEVVGYEYDICPELLEAIAYRETRFTPSARNGKHYGLMQVNVKVHKERIEKYGWTETDMFDAFKCMMVAADYLHELFLTYEDDAIVLFYYSGNTKAINRYKEYGFLCPYAEDVLGRSYEYEEIHGKHKLKEVDDETVSTNEGAGGH